MPLLNINIKLIIVLCSYIRIPLQHEKLICKSLSSPHCLPVENGRYNNILLERPLPHLCTSEIKDESFYIEMVYYSKPSVFNPTFIHKCIRIRNLGTSKYNKNTFIIRKFHVKTYLFSSDPFILI